MPNWCSVAMQIEGPRAGVHALVLAATQGSECSQWDGMPHGLLTEMAPIPKNKTVAAQREEWGTKWDVTDAELGVRVDLPEDRASADLVFDTAWSPPVEAVVTFLKENKDYDVRMQYFEPGVGFIGEYTPEQGEQTYRYDAATAETVREIVPEHLVDLFDLEGRLREFAAQ